VVFVNQRMFFARSIPHGVVFIESVIDVAHGAYDRREV